MTYRSNDKSGADEYSNPKSRLGQQTKPETRNEGCPVIEESGTVCGETNSLRIIEEFRRVYDECIKKVGSTPQGSKLLTKLTPVRKFIDDLWEQNKMLVETVEEIEQEAAAKVTKLQDKLNNSCQKELHCTLKAKERETECLSKELAEKDELLKKYCCQIEELKREMCLKNRQYKEIIRQLKCGTQKNCIALFAEVENDMDDGDNTELEELLLSFLKSLEDEKTSIFHQFQCAETQLKALTSEKKTWIMEKNDLGQQLQCLDAENLKLRREMEGPKMENLDKEELVKNLELLKSEKIELMNRVSDLQENIKELNNNFKETRWALTSEVAEKHDQVQELRRCVAVLQEQLRQADMQTHFKDDIIKELRKEVKSSRKSERRGLYDIVTELKGKKNQKNDNISAGIECDSAISGMSSSGKCSENNYYPPNPCPCPEGKDKNEEGSPRLHSQLECLKKILKVRLQQLRDQEELARDLEEELTTTKMDLAALQEKCERQERRSKSVGVTSLSEPEMNWYYTTLFCTVDKVEELLRNLSANQNCGMSNCDVFFEQELEKIWSLKNDLKNFEKNKVKFLPIQNRSKSSPRELEKSVQCENFNSNPVSESESGKCNLVHLDDVELFREKAVMGAAALEQMKEQIDILENLIRKYNEEIPCECDKVQVKTTEEKLDRLRSEFEEISDQMCFALEKLSQSFTEARLDNLINSDMLKFKRENIYTQTSAEVNMCQCKSLRAGIQEEDVQLPSELLDEELCQKRYELARYNQELNERVCEIESLREAVKRVGCRLKELNFGGSPNNHLDENDSPENQAPTLSNLFCDLQELWCTLEKTTDFLCDIPRKLKEDNEKLKENLNCLEKCVCNKEETLRVLQDTVKLREYQIDELKSRIQSSDTQSSKLAQDVEEKCRLIANLQETVRKCKQFEEDVKSVQIESLEFEVCGLSERLKKSEKEILVRDKKMESLHNEITALSSKNFILSHELKILEPRLKSLYKTSYLFENMVSDLQSDLSHKECEIENLCEKIKDLENELESEFKKCEERAAEDSKCIEELRFALKRYQNELRCNQEKYLFMASAEDRYKRDIESSEMREKKLNNTVLQLREEIKSLQQLQLQATSNEAQNRMADLENIIGQAEVQQQFCDKKIAELEEKLECAAVEREEERKCILEKLCCEKKENLKYKTLITKLNENIKRRMNNERNLKDYVDHFAANNESLRVEIEELKAEIEARKKMMSEIEGQEGINLSDIEELICHLKIQKTELKNRLSSLKLELDKEIKLKKLLESRVEDINCMFEQRLREFTELAKNYKNTSSHLSQTFNKMKETEQNLMSLENDLRQNMERCHDLDENESLKNFLNIKTAENARLMSQLQILQIDIESLQAENAVEQASKESLISQLQHEANCLESELQGLKTKYQKLADENQKLQEKLDHWGDKENSLQSEFREKQEKLCEELRTTICEKNTLLKNVDELQKQLERICLDNVDKEKWNRELMEECSRLKIQNNLSDNQMKNKSDKIINNLTNEVKNLQSELSSVKENFQYVNEEYQTLMERFKFSEKKKNSLEKLYTDVNNENKGLQELRMQYERDLCELKSQNSLLKEKISSIGENHKNPEDPKKFFDKIREMTTMIRTLEQRVIPNLEQEIAEKNCCIENLKIELREANISSQRIRNEALRVIQHTKKYLAAQRCANETLKSRLECSNKRGNMLGAENRDLEEQLKGVTRMNEFLLCQLENSKTDVSDGEPRSFSPLPWGCPTVERDTTSSSEYLVESGFQSMQPSPTNMDCTYDCKHDSKRPCPQWNSLKRNKHGGSVEYPPSQNSQDR